MATTNKTRYAILGMLVMEPMSGYDIKKHIERNLSYFWNENYGHLYPILKRLHADGWVTKQAEENEGKPTRYVYSITELGRRMLADWLTLPVERLPVRNEMLFKLFFGDMVSVESNRQRIADDLTFADQRQKQLEKLEEELRAELDRHKDDVEFRNNGIFRFMTVRQARYAAQAHVQWCRECLDILDGLEDVGDEKEEA